MKRTWLIGIGDFIAFWLSLTVILYIRFGNILNSDIALGHIAPFFILYISWKLTFYLFGLYDLFTIKPTIPHLRRFGMAIIVSFFIGILFFYFIPIFGISPKTNLLFQVIGFGTISFLFRRMFYTLYSKQITRPVVLIGEKSHLDELFNTIKNNPQIGLSILSYTQDLPETLNNYSRTKNAVFIIDTTSREISSNDIIKLYENNNEIINIAEAYERYLNKIPANYVSQSWIIENINIKKNMLYTSLIFITDKIFALAIIILSSPFFIIAIVARLSEDGRPIFIKQKRVGLNNKIFNLYKMRSMIVLSPDGSAETTEAKWSTGKNDSRITPVGKIIRKLHIDEIPQMINILKGDISLVGPRPERPEFVTLLEGTIPHYTLRHIIRPGFTGWAQIKYHYSNTVEESKEKFEYDLYYIKNRNVFLDFGIILRTIQIIFTH